MKFFMFRSAINPLAIAASMVLSHVGVATASHGPTVTHTVTAQSSNPQGISPDPQRT